MRNFTAALNEAAQTTALVFFILIGAMIFARFWCSPDCPTPSSPGSSTPASRRWRSSWLFLVMYFFLGMFQDSISMMSITLPVVTRSSCRLGIDPVYFAMLVIMAIELGLLTPPVGLNVYTVRSVATQIPEGQDVSLDDIFRGILPFFFLALVALVILILFPAISTFLPRAMFGR